MFPPLKNLDLRIHCFPRVRGDVPQADESGKKSYRFSPRARGCSYQNQAPATIESVFPACAGMFLLISCTLPGRFGFPRVRGDVPCMMIILSVSVSFSPRARGCSSRAVAWAYPVQVFPACAGMFPSRGCRRGCRRCFPRVRGDVPKDCPVPHRNPGFSPRARGCSRMGNHVQKGGIVFPCRGYSYQV